MKKPISINYKLLFVLAAIVAIVAVSVNIFDKENDDDDKKVTGASSQSADYNPDLRPGDFTTSITNKLFSVKPGKKLTYAATTPEGVQRVEITIDQKTKNVGGFETLVFHDQVYLNDQLVEDTKDYLAQHKTTGDVWYFGEEVDNYENGKLKDHHGTFLHGTDGAKAGIWIKAQQKVGDSYKQEYYKGVAEDILDVVAVDQTVVTKRATYKGCVKYYAWTPLEPDSKENKYYCPEVAGEVLAEQLTENKRTELVQVSN